MDYYWGDITPALFYKYVKAHNFKLEQQYKMTDMANHALGRYIMLAVADVLSGKNNYPKQPFSMDTRKSSLKNILNDAQVAQLLAKRNSEREQNEQDSQY